MNGEPSNLADTRCSRPLQQELADPTQGASAWSCCEHAREAPGMARAPATGAHHPGLPSEALEAAPATRPHCLLLEAKIAARSAVTAVSKHFKQTPWNGLLSWTTASPRSDGEGPYLNQTPTSTLHAVHLLASLVLTAHSVPGKTMTEIVQDSSTCFSATSCPGVPISLLQFLPGAESSLCLHISELSRCGRRLGCKLFSLTSRHLRVCTFSSEAHRWKLSPESLLTGLCDAAICDTAHSHKLDQV